MRELARHYREVFAGREDHTPGKLRKEDLIRRENGRIVSKRRSMAAKHHPALKAWREAMAYVRAHWKRTGRDDSMFFPKHFKKGSKAYLEVREEYERRR